MYFCIERPGMMLRDYLDRDRAAFVDRQALHETAL
jgi:hypothetical protein